MLGEILSIITALLWASSTIISAKTLKSIDPLSLNALRSLFSAVSMVPIAFLMGEIQNLSEIDFYGLLFVILAAIIGFGGGDLCLFKSIDQIGISKSYTIAYTAPMFTMLFATVFLGEAFLLKYIIGTVIIFIGIFIINVNGNGVRKGGGVLMAFAAAILWSIGANLLGFGLKNISPILANTIRYPFLSVFLFFISHLSGNKLKLSKRNLILSATSGILGMTLGGVTFLLSVQNIGVSRATSLTSSSPVWTTLISSLILKEKVTWRIITSSILVVVGTFFLT